MFIRVDPDFEADGLWDERGRMYRLDSMPLSRALRARIMAWQEDYSRHAVPWSDNDSFDYAASRREAEAIARLVKAEMPETLLPWIAASLATARWASACRTRAT